MNILDIITKKKNKEELTYDELSYAFLGYLNKEIPDYQMSSLLMAITINGMTLKETINLTDIFIKSGDTYLTGYTMNYLEALGLLKMDFLAIKDLTTMKMIIDDINEKLDLNKIDLEDERVLNEFKKVNTTGIFQFESEGMKSFLQKLKPSKFDDLVVALALYRPGPMQNIDTFIRRKEGKEKVDYITPELEDILKETYGIIVYQEQIMQIFTALADYSYSEADIIRRAISKKKEEVIKEEQIKFITRAKNLSLIHI